MQQRFFTLLLAVGVCFATAVYGDTEKPRHWRLLHQTMQAMRDAVEATEVGQKLSSEKLDLIREDVTLLLYRESVTRALVDYLVTEGRTEAGPLLRDYQVLTMKAHAVAAQPEQMPGVKDVLDAVGFEALGDGFGLSQKESPARTYLLKRVEEEKARVKKNAPAEEDIATRQNRLKTGARAMEHTAFILTLFAGLGMGYVGFENADYLGLRGMPLVKVATAFAAGMTTIAGTFNWVWPWYLRERFSKIFLRGRYLRLVKAYEHMLTIDFKTGLPQVVAMAIPSGSVILAQEDAALDALKQHNVPDDAEATTEALFTVAMANLEKGFVSRGDKIFRYLVDRAPKDAQKKPTDDLGKLAASARESIKAHGIFHTDLGKIKRRFIKKRLWGISGAFALVLGAVAYMEPNWMSVTQALALQGIGYAGLRTWLHFLWPAYPRETIRNNMLDSTTGLQQALQDLLQIGQDAKERGRVDVQALSVKILLSLARSAETGEAGELLRQTARDALHKFDDGVAMACLILKAQESVRDLAINTREPAESIHELLSQYGQQIDECLGHIANVGASKIIPPVTSATATTAVK